MEQPRSLEQRKPAPEAVAEEPLEEGSLGAGRWKRRTKMVPWTRPADRKRGFRT
jgi:hypothetical protein